MSFLVGLVALAALGGIAGSVVVWRRWRAEQHELARVRATFSRYVAPSVVDVLLARKDERLFTGRAVRATVLVCRIRNFAHFIEPLTPEQTLRYLNEFYGLAGTAIQRHRGIIDTFLGDGIIGVFGVPLDNPTQEDDALRAALEVVRNVVAMRDRWEKQNRKPFTIGIGINTGEVIAGDAGFRDRREFTVVGSEATFAHRLQEAAFAVNAFIVASRSTCEPFADEYLLVPVTGVPLAGVRRLLDAYVVRGRRHGVERFTVPDDALVETLIEPAPEPTPPQPPTPPAVPAASTSGLPAPVAAAPNVHVSPPLPPRPPPPAEPPVARPRPRANPTPAKSDLGLPELKHGWRFGEDDDARPILPDPPPPKATYEDRGGSFDL
ncbi:MAG: adenylate/guanylate cyclase domain-containing protein [Candidatus Eremiobacteraeota bacterium]|nr:adenylate/guanylate cyclase domain-containing protein [Candidatus Eremiobacteraeota bacterium]